MSADRTIKIPQVLNGALAASVYICGAQALGPMAIESKLAVSKLDFLAAWAGVAIFLWTTKNFVDDFRAFDGSADQAFNLGFTIFFSAAAYGVLALAAASLASGMVAAKLIALYFLVLTFWSACSWYRRRNVASPTAVEVRRMKRRRVWTFIYPTAAIASYLAATSLDWLGIGAACVVLAIYLYDIHDCKTFSTRDIEAA